MREQAAWHALANVPDPELPTLSIVDLGIVREVACDDEAGTLDVTLTPTYSGCPAVEVIEEAVRDALAPLGLVRVQRRLAPAWTSDWISNDGRRKLNEAGIAPPGPAIEAAQRERVITLHRKAPSCPRCASVRTERLSAFGATACKSLWRCLVCREPFEQFKAI